jgi:molybdopterin-synthase adenylyltransferase
MTPLTDEEKAIYEWQLDVRDFGKEGQTHLKNSSALISRLGGLGGPVALELAAAGIGKLVLAHEGNLKHSDLNRQILMSHDGLGESRVDMAKERLLALNPRMEIETVNENINEKNVSHLVETVDIVFDCAPLFEERFAMNRACVEQRKPLIDAAMFSLEGQVTTIIPGETPCLQCIYPEIPPAWKRKFPVIGAVSATAGCIAAMEGIKILSGIGPSLNGKMLFFDMAKMEFRKVPIARRVDCPICSAI